MRGLHLLLLTVLLLCSDHALSLQCNYCPGVQSVTQCWAAQCAKDYTRCYKGDLRLTLGNGQQLTTTYGGCARSCQEGDQVMKDACSLLTGQGGVSQASNDLLRQLISKCQLQGSSCCEKDLCNGAAQAGRSLWALGGGLLFSLGPALLWALL